MNKFQRIVSFVDDTFDLVTCTSRVLINFAIAFAFIAVGIKALM